jgi:hypothetical protein
MGVDRIERGSDVPRYVNQECIINGRKYLLSACGTRQVMDRLTAINSSHHKANYSAAHLPRQNLGWPSGYLLQVPVAEPRHRAQLVLLIGRQWAVVHLRNGIATQVSGLEDASFASSPNFPAQSYDATGIVKKLAHSETSRGLLAITKVLSSSVREFTWSLRRNSAKECPRFVKSSSGVAPSTENMGSKNGAWTDLLANTSARR